MWKQTKELAYIYVYAYKDFRRNGLSVRQSIILSTRGAYNLLQLLVALDIQNNLNRKK